MDIFRPQDQALVYKNPKKALENFVPPLRKPSKRYNLLESEEKISESLGKADFYEVVYSIKPWIVKNIQNEHFETILKKVCEPINEEKVQEFVSRVMELRLENRNFDEIVFLMKDFYDGNLEKDVRSVFKAEKIRESLMDYKKLLSAKKNSGEPVDYLKNLIKNLENQLVLLENPINMKSFRKYQNGVNEIFEFYAKQYQNSKAFMNLPSKKPTPSICLAYFLRFCNDFRFFEFPQITKSIISSIFKKNATYHKVMHKIQFCDSLFDISKLIFTSHNKLEQLYEYMECQNPKKYKEKLKPFILNDTTLMHSESEKIINQTLPCKNIKKNIQLKEKLMQIDKKPNIIMPKTSCNKVRTPITWKVLNETDLNSLGHEFDVRDFILETPMKPGNEPNKKSATMKEFDREWDEKRSKSELMTRPGRAIKPIHIKPIAVIKDIIT